MYTKQVIPLLSRVFVLNSFAEIAYVHFQLRLHLPSQNLMHTPAAAALLFNFLFSFFGPSRPMVSQSISLLSLSSKSGRHQAPEEAQRSNALALAPSSSMDGRENF